MDGVGRTDGRTGTARSAEQNESERDSEKGSSPPAEALGNASSHGARAILHFFPQIRLSPSAQGWGATNGMLKCNLTERESPS